MANSLRLPVLAAGLTLLALAACAKSNDAPAKTYTVDLNPPLTVGQKFSIATDLSDAEQTKIAYTIPGIPTPQDKDQNTDMAAHIEADGEILAVFPNGSPQKVALTLKNITAQVNKADLPNLPAAGAKVVLEKTGVNLEVTVNGQSVDDRLAKILRDSLEAGDPNLTNQTMFGPRSPVAVGGTWAVDAPSIIAAFKEGQGAVSGINGTMTLDSLTGTGADQIATVSGQVEIAGYRPPLPAGMTVDASAGLMQVSGTIPASAKGLKKLSTSMTMKLEAHGDDQGVQLKISSNGAQKKIAEVTFH